jgi:hypothetical protein
MNPDFFSQVFLDARQCIVDSRVQFALGSHEDESLRQAVDCLDQANVRRIQREFESGLANLNTAEGKLLIVLGGIDADQWPDVNRNLRVALGSIHELADRLNRLLLTA